MNLLASCLDLGLYYALEIFLVLGTIIPILVLSIHVGRLFWRDDSFPRDFLVCHLVSLTTRLPCGDVIFKNRLEAALLPSFTPLQRRQHQAKGAKIKFLRRCVDLAWGLVTSAVVATIVYVVNR